MIENQPSDNAHKKTHTLTKLTIISLLLAFLLAPIGLILSVAALVKASNWPNRAAAVIGVIIGGLLSWFLYFAIPIVIWLAGIQISPNPTVDQTKPIVSAIESFDAIKICEHSYNGHTYGPHGPYYAVYYRLKDDGSQKNELDSNKLKDALDDASQEMGFGMLMPWKNASSESRLKSFEGSESASEFYEMTANVTYDDEGKVEGQDSLMVQLHRAGSVQVSCDGNKLHETDSDEVIVFFELKQAPLKEKQILWHKG